MIVKSVGRTYGFVSQTRAPTAPGGHPRRFAPPGRSASPVKGSHAGSTRLPALPLSDPPAL